MTTYEGGYPDARDSAFTMGSLGAIGQIGAPFAYVPDLLPVGSGSAYFPRSVASDARALNFLGFLSDSDLDALRPSTGAQSGDMSQTAGAWDPRFRAGITRFQVAVGITNDSWVGPQTRTRLLGAVTAKNAGEVIPAPSVLPVPVIPGTVPALPAVLPGVLPVTDPKAAASEDNTLLYAGIGAAALAVGVGCWIAFK